jgi:hypothetical protein
MRERCGIVFRQVRHSRTLDLIEGLAAIALEDLHPFVELHAGELEISSVASKLAQTGA